ncbi:protoheme IX farnesyltransferase [Maritalea myrionectae]|uniref:Protoheme IX farnesyltransferase n=1 Tax=Maritalea myrionectae TaxID=454601 RepID=A0A2R4MHC3_9HYPH|nr:heme o synthase [Maritalea myrionectae]AVX05286.1 protoheme IX farnesyltransferase [Maritalea myrionectae]
MAYIGNQSDNTSWGGAEVEDYFALLKPRVMSLVIFTAIVGLLIAPGTLHPLLAFVAILCIAIGAGASGALNMWYDADIDAVMSRTINRPIPAGRVTRQEALGFGLVLSFFSVAILGLVTNWVAAGLLAFTIFFYAVIYTMWLKRWTPQNIVIGGAAGAFPPMIGWAAVTGTVTIESTILFLITFLWTPPHFWALALYKKGDYEQAGIPMLPNVAGERNTQHQILIYTLVLAAISVAPTLLGFASLAYGLVAGGLSAAFTFYAVKLWLQKDNVALKKAARQLFAFSLIYLFVVYLVLLADVSVANYFGGIGA